MVDWLYFEKVDWKKNNTYSQEFESLGDLHKFNTIDCRNVEECLIYIIFKY